jgi:hypothetical protein
MRISWPQPAMKNDDLMKISYFFQVRRLMGQNHAAKRIDTKASSPWLTQAESLF